MGIDADFLAHLKSGYTSVCRCWAVTRTDGVRLGFTDHDRTLSFEGIEFVAETGLTARALQQTTGLAVDNSEAVGALCSDMIREEDIAAGRYDGAEVLAWLVNWQDVSQRHLQFRGTLGELTRGDGAFQAELRGLTEALNQPQGRSFQKPCTAVLGDTNCKFSLKKTGFATEREIAEVLGNRVLRFNGMKSFDDRWFERGRFEIMSGAGAGLVGIVKNDRLTDAHREIELWEAPRLGLAVGDVIRFEAGCDKRVATCKHKFNNYINFQGFPHIPGEDWLMSVPRRGGRNDGGSRISGSGGGAA
ncbi:MULTISPECIES: DUF2163 domain-containing protein [Halocynthiibacter]|uniref:DUF2163 domain-containing protein n=1 Tax=Halocynthiibacter halioticoli TaxID=2986804 RepID=A0AAE3IXS6_9RHOB|nr:MULTISPECIES: DUF2163 domain-containing protein [Halocynthiibacter]MCV6824095.1 DUF2163 domain-containing protein [Halocynthiibacter halioticoli]MCW4057096.1 DUF2163 domain-containing protein [Halocynthiibacter sp. SDUM655004]